MPQVCLGVQANWVIRCSGEATRPVTSTLHVRRTPATCKRRKAAAVPKSSAAAGGSWPYQNTSSTSSSDHNGQPIQATRETSPGTASSNSSSSNGSQRHAWQHQQQHWQDFNVHTAGTAPPLLIASVGSLATAVLGMLELGADVLTAQRKRATRLAKRLSQPEARLLLEGCQLGACLLFIFLYVWSTYSPVVPGGTRWWCDLLLSLVFAADYAHRVLVTSTHPLLAMLHPLALIDLLSFAPSLLGAVLPVSVAPWGLDLRWFRVFRALRLLRLSLLSGNLSTMKSNKGALISGSLNVPLVWLVASVIAWMFTSASCVAVMEKWVWHDALYFVTSTLTTVGYGDVVVKSSMGRLFVLVMMLVGVVLIPVRASQLYSRLSQRLTAAGHPPGEAPGCKGAYVVLSGRLSDVRGFNDFLQDFLVQVHVQQTHPSGQRSPLQLVCLCNKPSVEFLALQELHESQLTLVEGSAFSERDLLQRAGLAGSVGAMVLADRFSSNAAAEDTEVQFRVWAIKSAVKRVPLYVQVLRRTSLKMISPFLDPSQDVISSIEGTRLRLLALSCFVPGASTLLANLLRSSGPNAGFAGGARHCSSWHRHTQRSSSMSSADDVNSLSYNGVWGARSLPTLSLGSRDGNASASTADGSTMAGRRWLREYADGAHCELFFCPAGPPLAGLRFSNAAEAVYEATGAMLVGVVQDTSQQLLLNPGSHVIRQGQQLVVLATTHQVAEAGAAGAGVEHTQVSQALKAAAVTAAATHSMYSKYGRKQPEVQQQQQQQHGDGKVYRGVTVRVPSLLADELASYVDVKQRPKFSSTAVGTSLQQQQQQQAMQQVMQHMAGHELDSSSFTQQQQQQRESESAQEIFAGTSSTSTSNTIDPAAAAAAAVLVDVVSQPGSSNFRQGSSIDELDQSLGDDDISLLNPCIANWSGAFESDSMDETEICTDSELLEAALIQRQRQQRRDQRQQLQLMRQMTQQPVLGVQQQEYGEAGADRVQGSGRGLQQQQQERAPAASASAAAATSSSIGRQHAGKPMVASAAVTADHDGQQQMQRLRYPQEQEKGRVKPGSSSSSASWQQQQQSFAPDPRPPPQHITGHFIMSGCAREFVPFAEQLHSIAPTVISPVTIVLLHPELPPPEVYSTISALGPAYYVKGMSSDSAALAAAGAQNARALVYLGPSERPTHYSYQAVSGVYGDPTSREPNQATDYNSTSRTAVLADADALSSCYGVGEVLLPDILHTVVELGFTSSIRFLQPGLMLHGRSAPHSHGSYDDSNSASGLGFGLLGAISSVFKGSSSSSSGSNRSGKAGDSGNSSSSSGRRHDMSQSTAADYEPMRQDAQAGRSSSSSSRFRTSGSSSSSKGMSPLPPPQQQQQRPHSKQPRSSWRHRKEIEDAGRAEGLTEWQLNSYYAAGRVMVPALLDTFTCQGFFKRRALLDLMTELAGDDGRPGGAMLQQLPVPHHLVGCTYRELVSHCLSAPQPQARHVPLGLLRRKAENRAWRLPYVATHPDPETLLQLTDAVFVIRPQ